MVCGVWFRVWGVVWFRATYVRQLRRQLAERGLQVVTLPRLPIQWVLFRLSFRMQRCAIRGRGAWSWMNCAVVVWGISLGRRPLLEWTVSVQANRPAWRHRFRVNVSGGMVLGIALEVRGSRVITTGYVNVS